MATLEELEARLNNLLSTAQVETKDIDLFAPIEEKEECPIYVSFHFLQKTKKLTSCHVVENTYAMVAPTEKR